MKPGFERAAVNFFGSDAAEAGSDETSSGIHGGGDVLPRPG